MKKLLALASFCFAAYFGFGQDMIRFHQDADITVFAIAQNDSLYFNDDHSTTFYNNGGSITSYITANIDSISFLHDEATSIFINYSDNNVSITNPLSSAGVVITNTGAHVVVNSTSAFGHINYIISGATTNGSFKIYSDNPFNVLMNNVSITNPTGPAVNNQSERQMDIILVENTINTFSDGTTYSVAPNLEDQKSTLFSEGDVDIIGAGSLNIDSNGSAQHAIATDKDLEIKQGQITVQGASKDGIHASDKFEIKGGDISVNSSDDGIAAEGQLKISCGNIHVTSMTADTKALSSDSLITILGGSIQITSSGAQAKGMGSDGNIDISGGDLQITSSGASVLTALGSGMDVHHAAAISADANIIISGGTTSITTTGVGGRGLNSDADVVITNGTLTIACTGNGATYTNSSGTADAYHSTCIKTDGNLQIDNGSVTASASGNGGKGIECEGDMTIGDGVSYPVVQVNTTGSNITITSGGGGGGPGGGNNGNYDEAKAIKTDLTFTLNSGLLTIDSNDDGIKSLAGVVFNGGELNIISSVEGVESPFITVNQGTIHVISSDDSFNGTHGTGGESDDGSLVLINDGYVVLNGSNGDPMDSNGDITINGGVILVHGPQSSPEVGMDYNGTGLVNGGTVIISGTNSNMTQGFNNTSTQRSLIMKSTSSLGANTIIHLEDNAGNELFSFKPIRAYYSIVYSSPSITNGTTYKLYSSGSHTGSVLDGNISGGTYSAGTLEQTFTVNAMVTTVNY